MQSDSLRVQYECRDGGAAMKKLKDDDLRCEPRLREQYKARIRIRELPDGEVPPRTVIRAITSDISTSGVRVAFLATRSVPVGASVDMRVRVGMLRTGFRLGGVVRWARCDPSSPANVMGVELAHTSDGTMRRWRAFLDGIAAARGLTSGGSEEEQADKQEES